MIIEADHYSPQQNSGSSFGLGCETHYAVAFSRPGYDA